MVVRVQVRDAVQRMVGVWPSLAKREALRQEIGSAIMRHAPSLEVDDLTHGITMLVNTARVQATDGGPAMPPGPGEVLGCILAAKRDRMADERGSAADRPTSAEDAGRTCTRQGCGSPLLWLPSEGAYYCDGCRTVRYA